MSTVFNAPVLNTIMETKFMVHQTLKVWCKEYDL
jgi:hypothetical protein